MRLGQVGHGDTPWWGSRAQPPPARRAFRNGATSRALVEPLRTRNEPLAPTSLFATTASPGITRKKVRHGWGYCDADGKRITDRDEIDRLNAIGLPPAYRDAWFCPKPNGHIQAIGWDEKGRKQYRYHPDFRAKQDSAKYDGCATFGRKLPKLRAQVEADLKLRGVSRETAVAAVVRLLDIGHIRVGNEGYAKSNNSFGATTLRNRHAKVDGQHAEAQVPRQIGQGARDDDHRPLAQPLRQEMPGPARPAPVPVARRRGRAASGHRRPTSTNISARRWTTISPPSISAPGARACWRSRRWSSARQGHRPEDDARAGHRGAGQHPGDRAQELCSSRADRRS